MFYLKSPFWIRVFGHKKVRFDKKKEKDTQSFGEVLANHAN